MADQSSSHKVWWKIQGLFFPLQEKSSWQMERDRKPAVIEKSQQQLCHSRLELSQPSREGWWVSGLGGKKKLNQEVRIVEDVRTYFQSFQVWPLSYSNKYRWLSYIRISDESKSYWSVLLWNFIGIAALCHVPTWNRFLNIFRSSKEDTQKLCRFIELHNRFPPNRNFAITFNSLWPLVGTSNWQSIGKQQDGLKKSGQSKVAINSWNKDYYFLWSDRYFPISNCWQAENAIGMEEVS